MADAYDGFREFVAARRIALSRAAFFLAGSESDAEDLLQDALAKTAARWPRLRDQNPEAYVRQVMLNAVRSRWRRRQKISERPTGDVPERANLEGAESNAVTKQLVSAALSRLTPRQRAVLWLRFYEDLSPVEAAPLLGCSVGTVKSQTHAALARLRQVAPELAPEPAPDRDETGVPE